MCTPPGSALPLVATVLLCAGALVGGPAAHAVEPITCQGRPATVVGTTGTEGDDVMVVVPQPDVIARAHGGDDTVCIAAPAENGIRSIVVDVGPGDDVVVNESDDVDDVGYTTILGTGADSYLGLDAVIPDDPRASPFYEAVYAGMRDLTRNGVDGSLDADVDIIDTRGGDDLVFSGTTTPGAANDDTVLLGAGDDRVEWGGEQHGSGILDLGTGTNTLGVHPGWTGTSSWVDAATRTARVDGRPVLSWSGWVDHYDLTLATRDQGFSGTNADETLVLASPAQSGDLATTGGRRTISMAGGDDHLALYSMGSGGVDGGPGHDTYSGRSCAEAAVRLDAVFTCVPVAGAAVRYAFGFTGFDRLVVIGGEVRVVGTQRAEKIKVVAAERIRVRARGGDDRINANTLGRLQGDDPVVLAGGPGADRLVGSLSRDVLLGGPGPDTSFGDGDGDVILGGVGQDRAAGQQGRDRCSAEVERSCEAQAR